MLKISLSNSSLKQAKSILENGHEIGLHYEPSFCNSDYEKHIIIDRKLKNGYSYPKIHCVK